MSMSLKDDVLNAVRDSKIERTCRCKTPKFRKPTVPPQQTVPHMPPTTGSNAFKSNPNYIPSSSVKKPCTYETPCGWCTKWDKKCDKKIGNEPIKPYDYLKEFQSNQICKSEEDHYWECCGISTAGSNYVCKKCHTHKFVPLETKSLETYLTESSVVQDIISNVIKEN